MGRDTHAQHGLDKLTGWNTAAIQGEGCRVIDTLKEGY